MGNSMVVSRTNYDFEMLGTELKEWETGLIPFNRRIARNMTGYMAGNRHAYKTAILYYSPEESSIKGIVFEVKNYSDFYTSERYYALITFDEKVNTKAQLTAFNKAKGKRADTSVGHSWSKRWYTRNYFDDHKGNAMPLSEAWAKAKKSPYDLVGISFGVLNTKRFDVIGDWYE